MTTAPILKAPFPAFGGKSRVADVVWSRLGGVRNYVEPFAFSAAMLLKRPDAPQVETINDLNHFVANFWRAVQADPEAVARHADWPVNEDDLHARHRWMVQSETANELLARVRTEPDFFDAKIAGWWCWGACCWIGSGWCDTAQQLPHLTNAQGVLTQKPHFSGDAGAYGAGIHSSALGKRPKLQCFNTTHGTGVHAEAKLPGERQPALGQAGWGINVSNRPQLADAFSRGRGVNGNDGLTACETRRQWITDWMCRLSDRLRSVRVCCGHWDRICDSPSTMTRLGLTGAFLDPPYRKTLACGKQNRSSHIYANDRVQDVGALCDEVQAWCLKWGNDPEVRIALCGLEGEYPGIEAAGGWEVHAWKSNGGYGNRKAGRGGEAGVNENAKRERIWFSPHCLLEHQDTKSLFGEQPA